MEENSGLIIFESNYSVSETIERLTEALKGKGFMIFTIIDHTEAAKKVGMEMPDTRVLFFGNPKAGTNLMLERLTLAVDLPSKILIYNGGNGKTEVVFSKMEYAARRHHLSKSVSEFDRTVEGIITDSLH